MLRVVIDAVRVLAVDL